MNKYKIEIIQTQIYIVDVTAKDESEAKDKANTKWNEIAKSGTHHLHEDRDPETEFGIIYDVTETDDPHEDRENE
jgi:hypothetical protein|tara:strand:+ start:2867 stop:3091 length:225 start_codon:yes stop_codon:yes gene_type:complete